MVGLPITRSTLFFQPNTIDVNIVSGSSITANVSGPIAISQAIPGTTNGVQVVAALPAGANLIGAVSVRGILIGAVSVEGSPFIQGNVPAAGADSGNGVKISGVQNTTPPTYTNGQRGDAQIGVRGSINTQIKNDATNNTAAVATPSTDAIAAAGGLTTTSQNLVYNVSGGNWDRMRGDDKGLWAQGNVASGATEAGNPVGVGGTGVTNAGTPGSVTTGQRVRGAFTLKGAQFVAVTDDTGVAAPFVTPATGLAAKSSLPVLAQNMLRNATNAGTTEDPQTGNFETTGMISLAAAAPTTTNGADQTNFNGRGVQITVDITAIATQTMIVTIQGKDQTSGKYYTLLASASLVGTGTTVLTVYPGCIGVANSVANLPVPRLWRVVAVGSVGGTITMTVGGCTLV